MLTEKTRIAIGIPIIHVAAFLVPTVLGFGPPIVFSLQVLPLMATYFIIRYYLVGDTQSAHLTIPRIVAYSFAALATGFASIYFDAWKLLLLLASELLPQYADALKALAANAGGNSSLAYLYLVLVAAIAIVALLAVQSRSPSSPTLPVDELDPTATAAIARAVTSQIERLAQDSAFTSAAPILLPTRVERQRSPSFTIRPPNLLKETTKLAPGRFLVLKGEPGSGKSVALLQLAGDLCRQIDRGGRIPILLNMREWDVAADRLSLAQIEASFADWVLKACSEQAPLALSNELSGVKFRALSRSGKFIFLLDSFDEIPAVMDHHHESSVTKNVSSALAAFVAGGSCAVIASRSYKSPILGSLSYTSLVLKQFDDREVRSYVARACHYPDRLLECIYRERRDLFVLSRNPFRLALLVHHANSHAGSPPSSEYDLYQSFFQDRLAAAALDLQRSRADVDSALQFASAFAEHLVQSPAPDAPLPEQLTVGHDAEVELLARAKLLSSGVRRRFTHRRFLEFLTVRRLLGEPQAGRPSLAAGYLDSNRDVLSLYGSVCDDEEASVLAGEAMEQIREAKSEFDQKGDYSAYQSMIITLRFLRDTFRQRQDILEPHQFELSEIIVEQWHTESLMRRKHCAEQLSLLPTPLATSLIAGSLDSSCGWLKRAALSEARYISDLQPWLSMRLARYASMVSDLRHYDFRRLLGASYLMEGGLDADRRHLDLDSVARAMIVIGILLAVGLRTPMAGNILFGLVVMFVVFRFLSKSLATMLDHMPGEGYNSGATGLVAQTSFYALFWALIAGLLGGFPKLSSIDVVALAVLYGGSVLLWANNWFLRQRETRWDMQLSRDLRSLLQDIRMPKVYTWSQVLQYIPLIFLVMLTLVSAVWPAADRLHKLVGILLIVAVVLMALFLAQRWLGTLFKLTLDRWTIRRLKYQFEPSRSFIASALGRIRSDAGRHEFLDWIQTRVDDFGDRLRQPFDDWPGGSPPVFDDFTLNNYIAILDEGWRGLSTR